ncbi:MAG: processing protein, partial [Pyrinomonadaceae bacterium]|nr:processing protein [Pyrinomonadaceae bacterium]
MREWIALNMTPGVGPRAAAKLLERFGSAEAVFGASRLELESLRLRPEAIESLMARDLFERAGDEIERVRALDAEILLLDDGVYPALLREIFDPPITLYLKGDWEACLDAPCVAV